MPRRDAAVRHRRDAAVRRRRDAAVRRRTKRWPRWLAGVVVALVPTVGWSPADATPAGTRIRFHLHDHRIQEASGIGVGIRTPGVVYVQNDSGDSARFFAVDRRTGRTVAVFTVPGAVNVDWEDLAVARDARGVASIWLADTGDNNARRQEVRIYRVDEPPVTDTLASVTQRTGRPDVWRLRYPGGPVNVEAMAVAPGGAITLATKSPVGDTTVYSVPSRPDANTVRVVRPIGSFRVPVADGPFGGGSLLGLLVTGGALSATGDWFVLRTYTNAYLWRVQRGDIGAALRTTPTRIALPAQPQGEGVTFDGAQVLIDSEGVGSAVWSVPLPTGPAPTTTSTAAPTTPSTAASTAASTVNPAGTATGSTTAAATPAAVGRASSATQKTSSRAGEIVGLATAALLFLAGAGVVLRSRRGARH